MRKATANWLSVVCVLVVAALCQASGQAAAQETAGAPFADVLSHLRVASLVTLDPSATKTGAGTGKPHFRGYIVTGRLDEIDAATSDAIKASLRAIIDAPRLGEDACFAPYHGAVFTDGNRRFELIICFLCSKYFVYDEKGEKVQGGSFQNSLVEKAKWVKVFHAAGLTAPTG